MKEMTVKVFRFDPETDEKPHFQIYLVRVNDGARVLHALHCIKEEHDPSLSYATVAHRGSAAAVLSR